MGHRRSRKSQRKSGQRRGEAAWVIALPDAPSNELDTEFALLLELQRPRAQVTIVRACGTCQEFIEDQEGGRGTCLHPGSGILLPWTDTPGCPFHARRRGA